MLPALLLAHEGREISWPRPITYSNIWLHTMDIRIWDIYTGPMKSLVTIWYISGQNKWAEILASFLRQIARAKSIYSHLWSKVKHHFGRVRVDSSYRLVCRRQPLLYRLTCDPNKFSITTESRELVTSAIDVSFWRDLNSTVNDAYGHTTMNYITSICYRTQRL